MNTVTEPGTIVTFYSYKGGVGRTMALANIAWLMACNGYKVLAIDWDLEGPGLHRYYRPFLDDKDVIESTGIIDLVQDWSMSNESDDLPFFDFGDYVLGVDWNFPGEGSLVMMPAGRQDDDYSRKVNRFDWAQFYGRGGGKAFIEQFRHWAKAEYQFVFIDSRAGVGDTSGICTIIMPDTLVGCFLLNYQNIAGIKQVLECAMEYKGPIPKKIFPLMTRVENNATNIKKLFVEYAQQQLRDFVVKPDVHAEREETAYWSDMLIPYNPLYSYGEVLSMFAEPSEDTNSLLKSFEKVARRVTGTNSIGMPKIPEMERQGLKRKAFKLDEDSEALKLDFEEKKLLLKFRVPWRENAYFTGRDDVLEELGRFLFAAETKSPTRAVAIVGLGGLGKTQTALQYVYQHRKDYTLVWWIDASERGNVDLEINELLHTLLDQRGKELEIKEALQYLHGEFLEKKKGDPQTRWLLIFDDVRESGDDGKMNWLNTYIRSDFKQDFQILITSRDNNWKEHLVKKILLSPWSETQSADFLAKRMPMVGVTVADVRVLADELGHLPLAMEQAAAYLSVTKCPIEKYLEQLKDENNIINMGYFSPESHHDPIRRTWAFSFEDAKTQNSVAEDIMYLCAFLGSTGIHGEWITEHPKSLPEHLGIANKDFNRAIETLSRYSLIKAEAGKVFSIHRLVQAVTREQMRGDSLKWANSAIRLIGTALPGDYKSEKDNEKYKELLPHAEAVCRYTKGLDIDKYSMEPWLDRVTGYAKKIEHDDIAIRFLQRLLEIRRENCKNIVCNLHMPDKNKTDLALTLLDSGKVYARLSKIDNAIKQYNEALDIFEKAYKPSDPEYVTTVYETWVAKAMAFAIQDKNDDAEDCFDKVKLEKKFSSELNLKVVWQRYNMAWLYFKKGQYTEAETIFKEGLIVRKKELGRMHTDVAWSHFGLAEVYHCQGRLYNAKKRYEVARCLFKKILGEDHSAVARASQGLAAIHHSQGNPSAAEPLLNETLKIREKTLGSNHPDTGWTCEDMARIKYQQKKFFEAVVFLRRARRIFSHSFQKPHTAIARNCQDMGEYFEVRGKYLAASRFYLKGLDLRKSLLGDHIEVAWSQVSLAKFYKRQDNLPKAKIHYQDASRIFQLNNANHPEVSRINDSLQEIEAHIER